jgi:hypothetical protein
MKITFSELIESKKQIDKKVDYYHNMLNSFPTSQNGLICDLYRKSNEYMEYKKQYNFWFKQLQEINKYIVKNFKKENNLHIMNKRFLKTN